MLSITVKMEPAKANRRAIVVDREHRIATIVTRGTKVNVVSSGKAVDSDQGVTVMSINVSKYNQQDY
jgi:hypothetical protein